MASGSDAKSQSTAFLLAVAAIGLLCTGMGIALNSTAYPFWSDFLKTVGGGALGSAFGLLFSRIFDPSPLRDIVSMLATTVSNPLVSPEAEVEPFRRTWHAYLLTRSGGKFIWRYRVFDFTRSRVPGYLHATVNVPRPGHGTHTYAYNGIVAGPRLVMVGKAEAGGEATIIQVYPHLGKHYAEVHAGLAVIESWDGDPLITPTLLSSDPLIEGAQEGTLSDAAGGRLDQRWAEEFGRRNGVPPVFKQFCASR